MLTFHTRVASAAALYGKLVLPYEQREKCRLRARLQSGEEVGVFTARGSVLRDGELLADQAGLVVQVVAALEPTYAIDCGDARTFARCAYHLGNRHTQLQIEGDTGGPGLLRIRVDTVLKEMLEGLGARVRQELAPFEPEAGAYAGGGHGHQHGPLAPVPLRQKIHRAGEPQP